MAMTAKQIADSEAEGQKLLARYNTPATPESIAWGNTVDQFKKDNYGPNGTATGLTEAQNLSNTAATNNADLLRRQSEQRTLNSGSSEPVHASPPFTGATSNNTTPTVTSTQKSPYDLILDMYNQSYEAQAQKLKALRDSRLAGLAGQDTLINNQAQSGLNANDVSGAKLSAALRERLAGDGLLQGGDFITQQTAQNTAQGENANNINMDRAQRLQNLAAQKDAINNNASADDLALLQQVTSDRMGAQLGQMNADRGYGLDLAGVSGQLPGGGGQTLAAKAQTYNQSPNNPNNVGQALQNQLSQLKLDSYPEETRQAAALFEQEFKKGTMTNEAAEYNLKQLKDPNSPTNQAAKLDLQMKQLEAKNLPEEQRLKLQQLKKEIAQIGVVHYKPQTASEIEMDKANLELLQGKVKELQNPKSKAGTTAEEYASNLKPQYDSENNLTNGQNLEDQIILSGLSDYEQFKLYKKYGLTWDDPIPQK